MMAESTEWSAITVHDIQQSFTAKLCRPWTWRLANGIMALFFALAAYVQINDPDPVIWVPMYAIPFLLCIMLAINSSLQDHLLWKWTAVIHLGPCFCGVLYLISVLLSSEIESKNPLNYEEGREIVGLFIVIVWLVLCRVTKLKSFSETTTYLWSAAVAISIIPFVLFTYYISTWDRSSLQSHCKDIISKHLFKQEM